MEHENNNVAASHPDVGSIAPTIHVVRALIQERGHNTWHSWHSYDNPNQLTRRAMQNYMGQPNITVIALMLCTIQRIQGYYTVNIAGRALRDDADKLLVFGSRSSAEVALERATTRG